MKRYWSPAEPTIIRYPRPAQGEWYEVDDGFDVECAEVKDGKAVESPVKKAEKQARIEADKAKRDKDRLDLAQQIMDAKNVNDLKPFILKLFGLQ